MIWFWARVNGWQEGFLREAYLGCWFGLLRLLIGLVLVWASWITQDRGGRGLRNGNRVGDKVPGGGAAAPTVAARRSLAGIELQPTVSKSESMGRERRERGFSFGDSGHEWGGGRWPATGSYDCGHGSSWGAWLWLESKWVGEEKEISLIWKCNGKDNWMEIRCTAKIRWQRSLSSKDKFLQQVLKMIFFSEWIWLVNFWDVTICSLNFTVQSWKLSVCPSKILAFLRFQISQAAIMNISMKYAIPKCRRPCWRRVW